MRTRHNRFLLIVLALLLSLGALSACSVGASKDDDKPAAPTAADSSGDLGRAESAPASVASSENPSRADGDSQGAPQAVYSQRVYDAGTVEAGTEIVHTFRVRNMGTADLRIDNVKPT